MSKHTISEALTLLEDGRWHSVAYVAADANKKQGGKIIRINECKILNQQNKVGSPLLKASTRHTSTKSQRHTINATRNLHLRNGLVRKMHIYTLFAIDKSPVL